MQNSPTGTLPVQGTGTLPVQGNYDTRQVGQPINVGSLAGSPRTPSR